MNHFTESDYKKIAAWFKAAAIKDSEMPLLNEGLSKEDTLIVVKDKDTNPKNYQTTISNFFKDSPLGDLSKLKTSNKESLVDAINELQLDAGTLSDVPNDSKVYNRKYGEWVEANEGMTEEQKTTLQTVSESIGDLSGLSTDVSADNLVEAINKAATLGGSGGGISDAPTNGKKYARQNNAWVELVDSVNIFNGLEFNKTFRAVNGIKMGEEVYLQDSIKLVKFASPLSDMYVYQWKNIPVPSVGVCDVYAIKSPEEGVTAWYVSGKYIILSSGTKEDKGNTTYNYFAPYIDAAFKDESLSDAPADGKQYARQNNAWTEVTSGGVSNAYTKTESDGLFVKKTEFGRPVTGVTATGDNEIKIEIDYATGPSTSFPLPMAEKTVDIESGNEKYTGGTISGDDLKMLYDTSENVTQLDHKVRELEESGGQVGPQGPAGPQGEKGDPGLTTAEKETLMTAATNANAAASLANSKAADASTAAVNADTARTSLVSSIQSIASGANVNEATIAQAALAVETSNEAKANADKAAGKAVWDGSKGGYIGISSGVFTGVTGINNQLTSQTTYHIALAKVHAIELEWTPNGTVNGSYRWAIVDGDSNVVKDSPKTGVSNPSTISSFYASRVDYPNWDNLTLYLTLNNNDVVTKEDFIFANSLTNIVNANMNEVKSQLKLNFDAMLTPLTGNALSFVNGYYYDRADNNHSRTDYIDVEGAVSLEAKGLQGNSSTAIIVFYDTAKCVLGHVTYINNVFDYDVNLAEHPGTKYIRICTNNSTINTNNIYTKASCIVKYNNLEGQINGFAGAAIESVTNLFMTEEKGASDLSGLALYGGTSATHSLKPAGNDTNSLICEVEEGDIVDISSILTSCNYCTAYAYFNGTVSDANLVAHYSDSQNALSSGNQNIKKRLVIPSGVTHILVSVNPIRIGEFEVYIRRYKVNKKSIDELFNEKTNTLVERVEAIEHEVFPEKYVNHIGDSTSGGYTSNVSVTGRLRKYMESHGLKLRTYGRGGENTTSFMAYQGCAPMVLNAPLNIPASGSVSFVPKSSLTRADGKYMDYFSFYQFDGTANRVSIKDVEIHGVKGTIAASQADRSAGIVFYNASGYAVKWFGPDDYAKEITGQSINAVSFRVCINAWSAGDVANNSAHVSINNTAIELTSHINQAGKYLDQGGSIVDGEGFYVSEPIAISETISNLYIDGLATPTGITFTRNEAGQAVTAHRGESIWCDNYNLAKGGVITAYVNNFAKTGREISEDWLYQMKKILEYGGNGKFILGTSHYFFNDYTEEEIEKIESKLKGEFGHHYFSAYEYFRDSGVSDAVRYGLFTPEQVAGKDYKEVFANSTYGDFLHFNKYASYLVARKFIEIGAQLGYWPLGDVSYEALTAEF